MPLRMNVYRCAWVTQYNPWPRIEEFRAVSDDEAKTMCKAVMVENRKTIVRMQLKRGTDTIWDSEFGDSMWTISMQGLVEMHIMEILRATGITDEIELSEFEIQNGLCELLRRIKGVTSET